MTSTTGTTRTTRTLGALALTLVLPLAACGGGDEDHNDADVAFATGMIPHHAQALDMVEMTEGRPLDPEVEELAAQIRDAQEPEIETMSGWLEEWGEEVPDTSGGMEDMSGMGDMSEMEGMMSAEDMSGLEQAPDAEFQEQWLTLMIEHHRGAVAMAEAEQADGSYEPALELAGEIVDGQTAEIETMESLLR